MKHVRHNEGLCTVVEIVMKSDADCCRSGVPRYLRYPHNYICYTLDAPITVGGGIAVPTEAPSQRVLQIDTDTKAMRDKLHAGAQY